MCRMARFPASNRKPLPLTPSSATVRLGLWSHHAACQHPIKRTSLGSRPPIWGGRDPRVIHPAPGAGLHQGGATGWEDSNRIPLRTLYPPTLESPSTDQA